MYMNGRGPMMGGPRGRGPMGGMHRPMGFRPMGMHRRNVPFPMAGLGMLLFPALLSGRGGNLPVRVVSLRSSNAEIGSSFTAAGINQTLHTVELQVSVEMLLLTPAGFLELTTETTVPLAQTVIVGSVPGTLIQTGE